MSSKPRRMSTYLLIAIPTLLGAGLAVLIVLSRRPVELGLLDGALRPCPEKPNCVCSTATDETHAIAPLALTSTDEEEALQQFTELVSLTGEMDGARFIEGDTSYARFVFSTPILSFQDDLELSLDADKTLVHVRSSARVGHSDLGVNRKRVEALRALWEAQSLAVKQAVVD